MSIEEQLLYWENKKNDYKTTRIHKVELKVLNYYIDYWNRHILEDNRELLYGYDDESGKYIGIDNTTDNCWVEEFKNEEDCINWLKGED